MRNILRIATVATALAIPVVAFAADPIAEPTNGFVRGMNIEWNALHLATFDEAAHRAFHALWAKNEREWIATQDTTSPGYSDARRIWLQERNLQHRAFHREQGLTGAMIEAAEMNAPSAPPQATKEPVPVSIRVTLPPLVGMTAPVTSTPSLPAVGRRYTKRISRRLLRAQVEARIAEERRMREAGGEQQ
jgi:hypothetical protein